MTVNYRTQMTNEKGTFPMSMTVGIREMADLLGQTVQVKIDGFTVPMQIIDIKIAYGNKRFLVSPVGGSGEQWVDATRADIALPVGKPLQRRASDTPPQSQPESEPSQTTEAGKVRAWARERGIHVNYRGRIPAPVLDQYRRETGSQ